MSDMGTHYDGCEQYHLECAKHALTASRERCKALEAFLLDSSHYGHKSYCSAICGPGDENWYEHERCDCGRNALLRQGERGEAKAAGVVDLR
jgi:hypothetical protein